MKHHFRRRKKMVRPRLQLRLVGIFLGLSLLGLVVQFVLLSTQLSELAADLGDHGAPLVEALPRMLISALAWSLLVALPATAVVGVLETFRFAGPLARIEAYLEALPQGGVSEPCRIRREDDLQRLVHLLNVATEPLRESGTDSTSKPPQAA